MIRTAFALIGIALLAGCTTSETAESAVSTSAGNDPAACLAGAPVEFLAGQVLLVGVDGDRLPDQAALFAQHAIGGAVVMTAPKGGVDLAQFAIDGGTAGNPVLLATDEEGGDVQRFRGLGALPSQQEVAATMTPAEARTMISDHGALLADAGIAMVLGPVADVAPTSGTSPLGSRVFSDRPAEVKRYVTAYVDGWGDAGLLPTLKHFPGLGSGSANTDEATATTPPLAELEQRDLRPYRGLADTETAVMIGNQRVPGWTDGPASLSPAVVDYLRETLGYRDNLVVSDALNADAIKAVTDDEVDAAVKAIAAGNDMALVIEPLASDESPDAFLGRLVDAVRSAIDSGTIPRAQVEASVRRGLAARHADACTAIPR